MTEQMTERNKTNKAKTNSTQDPQKLEQRLNSMEQALNEMRGKIGQLDHQMLRTEVETRQIRENVVGIEMMLRKNHPTNDAVINALNQVTNQINQLKADIEELQQDIDAIHNAINQNGKTATATKAKAK